MLSTRYVVKCGQLAPFIVKDWHIFALFIHSHTICKVIVCNNEDKLIPYLFFFADDVHNIKNFLTCLEDSSASKSNRDNSIYMFLANKATELWYVYISTKVIKMPLDNKSGRSQATWYEL